MDQDNTTTTMNATLVGGDKTTAMTMIQALRSAMDVMLERDNNVVVYGQDVGYFGGVFRCTDGLQAKYGSQRVFDAPISEGGIVGVAMNTGTQAAKEAGNMVDLDSDPTKLLDIVEIGKQLLITRGALTTFSIANDVAKYFAIIPAMFAGVLPALDRLNVMHLQSANSAILSAVIFNALIIVILIPLALRGVKFVPSSAAALLRRNLLIYGLGGLVSPFIGIKLIDMGLTAIGVK